MRDRIEFYEEPSPLRRERWIFWYSDSDHALVLDEYHVEERTSTKHKFKSIASYERLRSRRSHMPPGTLGEEDVRLTPMIAQRALDDFTSGLRVVRWNDIRR